MGIPTIGIGQLRNAVTRVRYPRALVTRFPRGQTMGPPGDHETQRQVLQTGLGHLVAATTPATVMDYPGAATGG